MALLALFIQIKNLIRFRLIAGAYMACETGVVYRTCDL